MFERVKAISLRLGDAIPFGEHIRTVTEVSQNHGDHGLVPSLIRVTFAPIGETKNEAQYSADALVSIVNRES